MHLRTLRSLNGSLLICGSVFLFAGCHLMGPRRHPEPESSKLIVDRLGPRKFAASIRDAEHVFATQELDLWCWAACASMLHRMNGREISQREIVERVQGIEGLEPGQERGASFFEVVRALTPDIGESTFTEFFGKEAEGILDQFTPGTELKGKVASRPLVYGYIKENGNLRTPAIDDLKAGHAALVGLSNPESDVGHVYVMIGATYTEPSDKLAGLFRRLEKANETGIREASSDERPLWKKWLNVDADLQAQIDALTIWRRQYEDLLTSEEVQLLYNQVGFDRYDTESVVLLDPYEESAESARVVMGGLEFLERVDFILSASDARDIAEKWTKGVDVKAVPAKANR